MFDSISSNRYPYEEQGHHRTFNLTLGQEVGTRSGGEYSSFPKIPNYSEFNEEIIEISTEDIKYPSKKIYNHEECGYRTRPFVFNSKYIRKYSGKIHNCRTLDSIPLPYEEVGYKGFRSDIYRFICLLMWYNDNIPHKYMDPLIIFKRCLLEGPSFTEELVELRKESLRKTFSSMDKDLERLVPELIGSIDYIFDPSCLIWWELPTEEEFLYSTSYIPRELTIEQKMSIDRVLNRMKLSPIEEPDDLDNLRYFKSTKVIHNNKSKWNYEVHADSKILHKYTDSFRFKMQPVWKNACEVREALICDVNTLHTIMDGSKILQSIFKNVDGYGNNLGTSKVYKLLNKIPRSFKKIMVDIKKCGWTIPRPLTNYILKSINSIYNNELIDIIIRAYDNTPIIKYNGENFYMHNGLGLGMFNELVTISCIVLYEIAKDNYIFSNNSKGIFCGDDQLIWDDILPSNMDETFEQYTSLMEEYGFLIHKVKPFFGDYGQFCELWTNTPISTEKKTRQINCILSCICTSNIVHAKNNFQNQYGKYWELVEDDYKFCLKKIIDWWGYEFSPSELDMPFLIGGWINKDIADITINYFNYPKKFRRLIFCEQPTFWPQQSKKISNTLKDIINLFSSSKPYTLVYNWFEGIKQSLSNVEAMINATIRTVGNLTSKKISYFSNMKELRKNTFNSKLSEKENFIDNLKRLDYSKFKVPDELILIDNFNIKFFPKFKAKPIDFDIRRWSIQDIENLNIRRQKGFMSSFYNLIIPKEYNEINDPIMWGHMLENIGKLRYLNISFNNYVELVNKHGYNFTLDCKNSSDYNDLQKLSIGNGKVPIPVGALLINMDPSHDVYYSDNINELNDSHIIMIAKSLGLPENSVMDFIKKSHEEMFEKEFISSNPFYIEPEKELIEEYKPWEYLGMTEEHYNSINNEFKSYLTTFNRDRVTLPEDPDSQDFIQRIDTSLYERVIMEDDEEFNADMEGASLFGDNSDSDDD